jgi:hypothetical protein
MASQQAPGAENELIFNGTWKEEVTAKMSQSFNESELIDFLSERFPFVRFEDLTGTLKQKCRNVVEYAERHGLCSELIAALQQERGHLSWPYQ